MDVDVTGDFSRWMNELVMVTRTVDVRNYSGKFSGRREGRELAKNYTYEI